MEWFFLIVALGCSFIAGYLFGQPSAGVVEPVRSPFVDVPRYEPAPAVAQELPPVPPAAVEVVAGPSPTTPADPAPPPGLGRKRANLKKPKRKR